MSIYQFAPANRDNCNAPFVSWNDAFTVEELDRIKQIGDALQAEKSSIGDLSIEEEYSEIRISKNSWIELNPDTEWLYERLASVARNLNANFYGYDLYGFLEHMQYTVYTGDDKSHYTWHTDSAGITPTPRKLTLVLQLSDPSEYEGGDLELLTRADPDVVDKQLGRIVAFPSWTLHRVTPVTSGIRKTLVVWITGPTFR